MISSTPLPRKETAGQTKPKISSTKGKLLFFRAYCYFNLVRALAKYLWWFTRSTMPRKPTSRRLPPIKSMRQIDTDLKTAEESLPETWAPNIPDAWLGSCPFEHARTYMMRSDWDNMYKASTDVINKVYIIWKLRITEIFTDDGDNRAVLYSNCNVPLLPPFPQSDVIGSQFCRKCKAFAEPGQWDLGWDGTWQPSWWRHAYETGDPRKTPPCSASAKRTMNRSPRKTPTNLTANPRLSGYGAYFNKKPYRPGTA